MPDVIERTLLTHVVLIPDELADGYHIVIAGLRVGFLQDKLHGVRASFLPGTVPENVQWLDFDSLDAFLEQLTVMHDTRGSE